MAVANGVAILEGQVRRQSIRTHALSVSRFGTKGTLLVSVQLTACGPSALLLWESIMKKFLTAAVALGLLASFAGRAGGGQRSRICLPVQRPGTRRLGQARGSAEYRVQDGCIVGKCTPNTPDNTFLCSEKEFGNFVLKLQYRFLEPGNSGIQFRSAARSEGNLQRVYGYQYEMTPDGELTGRIYDEGRRGHQFGVIWLDAYTPQDRLDAARASCKQGEWNDVEIQCVGPSIKTWLNGKLVVDMFDSFSMKGFFGLQIHAGTSGSVAWRNIRVKDLGESRWEPFFVKGADGKYQLASANSFSRKSGLSGRTAFCTAFTRKTKKKTD